MSGEILFALRMLWREWRAGELSLLAAAVVIAVAGVTTVGFFTHRVHQALDRQAAVLLGADLVVGGDRPLPDGYAAQAAAHGLAVAGVMRFPSMALHGTASVLADIKVVTPGYPLRGELRIADAPYGADRPARGIPAPGTIWADERLYHQLGVARGATVELGNARYTLAAVITQEPDAGLSLLNAAPRVLLNQADLAATGLVQPGSRIRYRLQVAGESAAVDAYRAWAQPRLQAGQRIEGVRDARPEVRSALERAERFLALAALVSVVVAAAGTALAARRFVQRHLDSTAVMRCLGASSRRMVGSYALQLLILGLLGSIAGGVVGVAAQSLLAHWLAGLVKVQLPPPGVLPALYGLVTGVLLLLGFALPPLAALGRITPLRVLRRDLGLPARAGYAGYAAGMIAIVGLIYWRAGEAQLGTYVAGGFLGTILVGAGLTWLLVRALGALRYAGVTWRFGIANLQRHALGTIVQTVALAVGIMALLTLTLIRGDLLAAWERSLPERAPNRFVVNVQPEQIQDVAAYFGDQDIAPPVLYPMVRGRLVAVNGMTVSAETYTDDRARRLAEREFNLSWAERMRADNRLVAGRWWTTAGPRDQLSMEEEIARTLGLELGDRLTFDIAGTPVSVRITSLRKVEWDSFNVNFFAIVPPGLLEGQPVSYVTSFYLPPGDQTVLSGLVQRFPNLLVIDVAQVLGQVQQIMGQVARAVQFVFLFTVLAGLVVLYAAIASAQDERLYQATIMRTLGATRAQLLRATVAEFMVAGGVAGLLAAAGATALGFVLATRLLHLDYAFNGGVWIAGVAGGALAISLAGYFGTRRVLRTRPLQLLRELA